MELHMILSPEHPNIRFLSALIFMDTRMIHSPSVSHFVFLKQPVCSERSIEVILLRLHRVLRYVGLWEYPSLEHLR